MQRHYDEFDAKETGSLRRALVPWAAILAVMVLLCVVLTLRHQNQDHPRQDFGGTHSPVLEIANGAAQSESAGREHQGHDE
jgi:hypothetical protein